jgi:GntR family transcriptional regulator, transcriptional repressor for pyruvate dehydrogenase complex
MFKQLKTKKYNEQIIDQIRKLIENGTLKKGDRLPSERILAEQFGSSRASIREALSALDVMGIIETRTGSGNYIKVNIEESSIDEMIIRDLLAHHNLFDIYEARQQIEPSLITLAAVRKTKKDINELKKISQRLLNIANSLTKHPELVDEYMDEDMKFHVKIAEMAHNPILLKLYSTISSLLKEESWLELKKADILEKGATMTELEHKAIVDAIVEGDPDLARDKLLIHLERIRKGLLSKLGTIQDTIKEDIK